MKRALAATALVALLIASGAAYAQDGRWSDPRDRYQLDRSGWTDVPLEGLPHDADDLLFVEHQGLGRAGVMPSCHVRASRLEEAPRNLSQSQANRPAQRYTRRDIEGIVGAQLLTLDHAELEGVFVSSFSFDAEEDRDFWRLFYLSDNGEVVQVQIVCSTRSPPSDEELAAMTAFLNSLIILPESDQ